MNVKQIDQNEYDQITSKIDTSDILEHAYPSKYGKIILPLEDADLNSLETTDHVRIINDVENTLDVLGEILGNGVHSSFMMIKDIKVKELGLSAVTYFNDEYNTLSLEINRSLTCSSEKKAKSEAFDVIGMQHILFINYKDKEVTISNISGKLQKLLFGNVLFHGGTSLSAQSFVKYVTDLKEKTNNTFNAAGVQLTAKNYHNFFSLILEPKAFEYYAPTELEQDYVYSVNASNKEIAQLAAKGYNLEMLYLFYLNDYYPTDEELDSLNKMPYNWRVAVINDR